MHTHTQSEMSPGFDKPGVPDLRSYTWLSMGAALLTLGLKGWAWDLTGSLGLLSDALETLVNVVAAALAWLVLRIAQRPPDTEYPYGYDKAEFFFSGMEGTLITVTGCWLMWHALWRLGGGDLLDPAGLWWGIVLAFPAMLVNGGVAYVLSRAGKRYGSRVLVSNATHLWADVWTSAGVISGLMVVHWTGYTRIDPLIALAVSGQILWMGWKLLRGSVLGLMDPSIGPVLEAEVIAILERYRASHPIAYHALRTRRASQRCFVTLHVLVPGSWSVQAGHDIVEAIEQEIAQRIPRVSMVIHLEPLEDQRAWTDLDLDHSYDADRQR